MISKELYLAPVPKRMSLRDGALNSTDKRYIQLVAECPRSLITAAGRCGLNWEITASPNVPKEQIGLVIDLDKSCDIPAEGYHLTIDQNLITINASDPAGAFYAACTLAQIIRQSDGNIPCLSIQDWPDFACRGVMLDISRDKVPTMDTLYHLVDLLAQWKINQFQLYTEHTFAYLAHPRVWEHASPMTGEQILDLDSYCKSRFIELVPNQNSFGHMERWLKYDEYRPMAESPYGGMTSLGFELDYPFSISPTDERCVPFIDGLYQELLPHFSSRLFNVGCDETFDLGYGKSKKLCEERGAERVYLDFLMEIYKLTTRHGRTMQFWGDIILHSPELIGELPKDVIALEWGYEADHPFMDHSARFKESGIPFYVCPGTSAWNSIAGRTENAIGNITSAARIGFANGALGLLNTSWGDSGHWDPLSVEYLGFMVGAMASWNVEADIDKNLPRNLSLHAFGDETGKLGQAFYDLGNIYLSFKKRTFNCAVPWQVLFHSKHQKDIMDDLRVDEFEEMERRLTGISSAVAGERATSADADIVRQELQFVIDVLLLAGEAGKKRVGGGDIRDCETGVEKIKSEHRRVWLLRNRIGGIEDSVANLNRALED